MEKLLHGEEEYTLFDKSIQADIDNLGKLLHAREEYFLFPLLECNTWPPWPWPNIKVLPWMGGEERLEDLIQKTKLNIKILV